MKELSTQYNKFAESFSASHDMGENSNRDNRAVFYKHLGFIKRTDKILDLGCGDGLDMAYYAGLGAEVHGIDASGELIKIAQSRLPGADIREGFFEKLPYQDGAFDVVLSKYAIQTSTDMAACFDEIYRVLKPGGVLTYLVTHPMRQFFERKEAAADYFEQKVVDSNILSNTIVVQEPTHTFNEYLSADFLKRFDVVEFGEYWDKAAEQIGGSKYPGYFIIKAVKRKPAA